MRPRRVVVTGLGTVSPCGLDVPTTWDSMVQARSGTALISRFDASDLPVQIAAQVEGYDGTEHFGRRAVRRLGLFMQYAMTAADQAMADGGYDLQAVMDAAHEDDGPFDKDRFGVYVGTGIGGFPEIQEGAEARIVEGTKRISPFFIPGALNNLALGQIAIRFGLRGPSLCIATACAVGNHSIGEAWRSIAYGEADRCLAGGTEAALSTLGFGGFMTMRALSKNNQHPTSASRPFDATRDGFVMGEGAGIVLIEEEEAAKARGAHIYCELAGYACTTDAHHVTSPAPGHAGAVRCMRRALEVAGVGVDQVDYINAHGTSTAVNDREETAAIKTVFGDHAGRLAVSSTKGVSGHLLGAAGGLEAVAVSKAIEQGIIPPTAHLENADPECDLDYVPREARRQRVNVAISNGFGFGGMNACLVFKAYR